MQWSSALWKRLELLGLLATMLFVDWFRKRLARSALAFRHQLFLTPGTVRRVGDVVCTKAGTAIRHALIEGSSGRPTVYGTTKN
jgi:hypothetical protein